MAILVLLALLFQSRLPSYSMFIIQGTSYNFILGFEFDQGIFSLQAFSLVSGLSLFWPVCQQKCAFLGIGLLRSMAPIGKI